MKLTRIILPLLFFFCANGFGQTVDFTYTVSTGFACNPTAVSFSPQTSQTPNAYLWNFGNGVSSNQAFEKITYLNGGSYTITLTAIYPDKAITASKTIVINTTPSITITTPAINLCKTGPVSFSASSSVPLSNYNWTFGDSSLSENTSNNFITHNYQQLGSYTVYITATTPQGCTATDSLKINLKKINLTGVVSPSNGCLPVTATLGINATLLAGDALQQIIWNTGDNSATTNTTQTTLSHNYTTTNVITGATAAVTTNNGCSAVYTFPPFGYGIPPLGGIARTQNNLDSFCASETVSFFATATNANQYEWKFGDGSIVVSNGNNTSHLYRSLGAKTVTCTPMLNGCKGTPISFPVFIKGVVANYVYSNACNAKNNYQFTNQSLGTISSYTWQFFDSTTASYNTTQLNPSHTYPPTGSHAVQLVLQDNTSGCSDSVFRFIYTALPTATSGPAIICKDSLIRFNVSNAYPKGKGYRYDFVVNGVPYSMGDSTSFSIRANQYGNTNAYVIIRDNIPGTCNDTIPVLPPIIIRGPVSQFSIPATVCLGNPVVINNLSRPTFNSDPIIKWNWNFKDGTYDSVAAPNPHLFKQPGIYDVLLTTTDMNGCANFYLNRIIVKPTPSVTIIPNMATICNGNAYTLIAVTADSIAWSPALGLSNTNSDTVIATPNTSTQYIANVYNQFGCKAADTASIKVIQPFTANIAISQTPVCPGSPVQLTLNQSGIIQWSPAIGLNATTGKMVTAINSASQLYTATVTDSSGCFSDTAYADITVFPTPSVQAGPDLLLNYNSLYQINPVYTNSIAQYNWTSTQPINCSSCTNIAGIATTSATYQIKVTDNNGCKASDEVAIHIRCEQSNLLIPTAFTPNGDGLNDYFYPIARGYQVIKKMLVLNRAGNVVFERDQFAPNQPLLGWDGRVKGENNQSTQTFIWLVEAICESGEPVVRKGTITLVR